MKIFINDIAETNSHRVWTADGETSIVIKKLADVAEYLRGAAYTEIVTDEVTHSLLHTVYGVC